MFYNPTNVIEYTKYKKEAMTHQLKVWFDCEKEQEKEKMYVEMNSSEAHQTYWTLCASQKPDYRVKHFNFLKISRLS